jgi:hypothetical protein
VVLPSNVSQYFNQYEYFCVCNPLCNLIFIAEVNCKDILAVVVSVISKVPGIFESVYIVVVFLRHIESTACRQF